MMVKKSVKIVHVTTEVLVRELQMDMRIGSARQTKKNELSRCKSPCRGTLQHGDVQRDLPNYEGGT